MHNGNIPHIPGRGGPVGLSEGRLSSALDLDNTATPKVYDRNVISRLIKYISKARVKLLIVAGAMGMIIGAMAQLAIPYLIATGTDRFIEQHDLNGLNNLVFIYFGVLAISWLGKFIETRSLEYAGQKIIAKMRYEMFTHLQNLSLRFFDNNSVGKLMSRIQNDVQELEQLITSGFLNIITDAITIIGIIIIMLFMNWQLAIVSLISIPLMVLFMTIWRKYASRQFLKTRQTIAVVNARLQQNISGVRVIQSFAKEESNFEDFDTVNKGNLNTNIAVSRLTALMQPMVEILIAITTASIIVVGGYQIINGQIGVGVIIGFLMYITRFFNPIRELSQEYSTLQRAMASGGRIFELLDTKPEIEDKNNAIDLPPIRGSIQFSNVNFNYRDGIDVLHNINISISPGETIAIVGKTGSGKSTLISLLCRFYETNSGEILIDGYSIKEITNRSLMDQISIVPQDALLFSGSIAGNIKYGLEKADTQQIIDAAKKAGAHEFISRLKDGYETKISERGINLSTGQRQLICFARAIIKNPPILILDEATANVDTKTEEIIRKALIDDKTKRTCLIIAHRLSTAVFANRIIVMDQGRIIEIGSHEQLMENRGLYYKMQEVNIVREPSS